MDSGKWFTKKLGPKKASFPQIFLVCYRLIFFCHFHLSSLLFYTVILTESNKDSVTLDWPPRLEQSDLKTHAANLYYTLDTQTVVGWIIMWIYWLTYVVIHNSIEKRWPSNWRRKTSSLNSGLGYRGRLYMIKNRSLYQYSKDQKLWITVGNFKYLSYLENHLI